jgi:hypothetical protein
VTDIPSTPPTPDSSPSEGLSPAPSDPPSSTPPASDPNLPDTPVGSPSQTAPAPAGGRRSGCMTSMLALFVVVAALLALLTQL